jgi:transcription elongation factor GreA
MPSHRPTEPVERALLPPTSPPAGAALTVEGRRLLEERVDLLETAVAELDDALRDPDRRADVVEAYQRAAGEVAELRALLCNAAVLDDLPDDPRRVDLGDHVSIRLDDGTEETYVVVHRAEAVVDDARISVESPLGQALLGRGVGDTVEVAVPAGPYRCTILSATRRVPQTGR